MMMSGSCRRKARRAAAKFNPISAFIWTWLTPARLYSTGSSAVMMLVSTVFNRCRPEYRDAVDAVPDPEGFLVRLDVDVRGPLLDGVAQDQVHQLDHRGILGRPLQVADVRPLVPLLDRRHFPVVVALEDIFHQSGRVIVLVNGILDRGLGRDQECH